MYNPPFPSRYSFSTSPSSRLIQPAGVPSSQVLQKKPSETITISYSERFSGRRVSLWKLYSSSPSVLVIAEKVVRFSSKMGSGEVMSLSFCHTNMSIAYEFDIVSSNKLNRNRKNLTFLGFSSEFIFMWFLLKRIN
jgi:hypothetical protein